MISTGEKDLLRDVECMVSWGRVSESRDPSSDKCNNSKIASDDLNFLAGRFCSRPWAWAFGRYLRTVESETAIPVWPTQLGRACCPRWDNWTTFDE